MDVMLENMTFWGIKVVFFKLKIQSIIFVLLDIISRLGLDSEYSCFLILWWLPKFI